MQNKLWRYGDSYSKTQDEEYGHIESNHSVYIAEHFGLELNHRGAGGFSNLHIVSRILEDIDNITKGDMVLINFACKSRVGVVTNDYADDTGIISSAYYFEEIPQSIMDILVDNSQPYISNVVFHIAKILIETLINRGVDVYHFYNSHIEVSENIPNTIPNQLIFEGGSYQNWLCDNYYQDLSPTGNEHYVLGKQKVISEHIISRIKNIKN